MAINRGKLARMRIPHVDVEALRDLASSDDPYRNLAEGERDAIVAAAVETLPDVYWVLFAFFAASLLLPTVVGVPLAILAAAVAAFPEKLARVVAVLAR